MSRVSRVWTSPVTVPECSAKTSAAYVKFLCRLGLAAFIPLSGCSSSTCTTASAIAYSEQVTLTSNPQVASYTYDAPSSGTVYVQFGTDTSYGRKTAAVITSGGPTTILVAGMKSNTTYHMQAVFQGNDNSLLDTDQTFTTGGVPCKVSATVSVSTANNETPQPGIEMLDGINDENAPIPFATDLEGNIIWTYPYPDQIAGMTAFPIRLLSNGNLLMLLAHNSSTVLDMTGDLDTNSEMREVNLAGDTVASLPIAQLNESLAAKSFSFSASGFSHDVLPLDNGHFLVDVTTVKSVVLSGDTSATTVLGDAIVDLDANFQPTWAWNTFDHLDVNRHPFNFPDWTHANAISLDPNDGSILYSLRHQNWVLKINYANGEGDGSIVWKLGPDGDFTLRTAAGGTDSDPGDWFYSQHGIEYLSTDTTGRITLSLMDNGDDRTLASGATCPVNGGSACYTTIPVLQLDQSEMNAQFLFHEVLSPSLYSSWGGNTNLLDNGHVQYFLSGLDNATNSAGYEVTNESSPKTVWSIQILDGQVYRGERWPSLYPNIQW